MQALKHLFAVTNTRAGRGYIGGLRTTAACGGDKGVKKLGRNLVLRKQREAQSLSSNPDNTVPINHRHITIPQLSAPWAEKCVVLIGTYPPVLHCWQLL